MRYSEEWDFLEKIGKKKLRAAGLGNSGNGKKYKAAIF